jgi:hypothetical protein
MVKEWGRTDGSVSVSLALQPALAPGHGIQLTVDGRPLAETGKSLAVTLANMDRGAHTVSATVVDARGQPVATTSAVSFHVLRVAAGTNLREPCAKHCVQDACRRLRARSVLLG